MIPSGSHVVAAVAVFGAVEAATTSSRVDHTNERRHDDDDSDDDDDSGGSDGGGEDDEDDAMLATKSAQLPINRHAAFVGPSPSPPFERALASVWRVAVGSKWCRNSRWSVSIDSVAVSVILPPTEANETVDGVCLGCVFLCCVRLCTRPVSKSWITSPPQPASVTSQIHDGTRLCVCVCASARARVCVRVRVRVCAWVVVIWLWGVVVWSWGVVIRRRHNWSPLLIPCRCYVLSFRARACFVLAGWLTRSLYRYHDPIAALELRRSTSSLTVDGVAAASLGGDGDGNGNGNDNDEEDDGQIHLEKFMPLQMPFALSPHRAHVASLLLHWWHILRLRQQNLAAQRPPILLTSPPAAAAAAAAVQPTNTRDGRAEAVLVRHLALLVEMFGRSAHARWLVGSSTSSSNNNRAVVAVEEQLTRVGLAEVAGLFRCFIAGRGSDAGAGAGAGAGGAGGAGAGGCAGGCAGACRYVPHVFGAWRNSAMDKYMDRNRRNGAADCPWPAEPCVCLLSLCRVARCCCRWFRCHQS